MEGPGSIACETDSQDGEGNAMENTANVIERLIADQGFESVGTCAAGDLVVREEVRESCASGKCPIYGTSWACPPACGDIYEYERQMHEFETCAIVQTVAELEDDFDAETMMEAADLQQRRMHALVDAIDEAGLSAETMALSAGTCTLCSKCTYPDEPCRFPDKRLVSMEAAGLVVSEVCLQAGIPYNHGPQTIAFSGCVLYN